MTAKIHQKTWDRFPDAKDIQTDPNNRNVLIIDGVRISYSTGKPVRPGGRGVHPRTWARFPNAKDIQLIPGNKDYLLIDGIKTNRKTGLPTGRKSSGATVKTRARYPGATDIQTIPGNPGYLLIDGVKTNRRTGRPFGSKLRPGTKISQATWDRFPDAKEIIGEHQKQSWLVDGVRISRKTFLPVRTEKLGRPSGGKRNLHANIKARFPDAKDIRRDPNNKNHIIIDGITYTDRRLNPVKTGDTK